MLTHGSQEHDNFQLWTECQWVKARAHPSLKTHGSYTLQWHIHIFLTIETPYSWDLYIRSGPTSWVGSVSRGKQTGRFSENIGSCFVEAGGRSVDYPQITKALRSTSIRHRSSVKASTGFMSNQCWWTSMIIRHRSRVTALDRYLIIADRLYPSAGSPALINVNALSAAWEFNHRLICKALIIIF